jgi:hypothetical protein
MRTGSRPVPQYGTGIRDWVPLIPSDSYPEMGGVWLSGQPGRTDVGLGRLRLGSYNARSSLGVPNGFTIAASTFV